MFKRGSLLKHAITIAGISTVCWCVYGGARIIVDMLEHSVDRHQSLAQDDIDSYLYWHEKSAKRDSK
jgi:hypothetical protein